MKTLHRKFGNNNIGISNMLAVTAIVILIAAAALGVYAVYVLGSSVIGTSSSVSTRN